MGRCLTAISEGNLEAMAAMQTADGMTCQWRQTEGGMHITAHPNSHWTDPSHDDGHACRERYRSPHVVIRGGIAVVWAPHEFRTDGESSRCGVDGIDFVKIDGKWLASSVTWTVEPEACAPSRPVGARDLRPEY